MATPLAQLVHDVVHDADVRARFAAAPESFLADHGHDQLDAGELREAFFVLADGSAPAEASAYQAGGQAIGDDDLDGGSAASGLAGALTAILGSVFDLDLGADPADLDGADDDDVQVDSEADNPDTAGSTSAGVDTEAESDTVGADRAGILYADDVDQPETELDGTGVGAAAGLAAGAAGVDVLDGLPGLDETVFSDETVIRDIEPVADDGDGWDDVI